MEKQPELFQPTVRKSSPTKEMVRAWLAQRRSQREPPPGIDQIRKQLDWR